MVYEAVLWSIIALFLGLIALVAFENHAKPIGWLFAALTVGALAYLVVRWRQFRKDKKPEAAPSVGE